MRLSQLDRARAYSPPSLGRSEAPTRPSTKEEDGMYIGIGALILIIILIIILL